MKSHTSKNVLMGGLVALALLPGCTWFGQSGDTMAQKGAAGEVEPVLVGDVVVTMNGKPLITTGVLEEEKENIFKSNPQIRAAIAFMDPKVLDRNLTDGLVGQAVVDQYVKDHRLNQSEEYKTELKDAQKAIERMLNAKYFSQKFTVSVSDSEAKDFYEKNKDMMPGLLLTQGGVAAMGVEFDNDVAAREFLTKVRMHQGSLKNAADEMGLSSKVKDFKMVNAQSIGMDQALRDKIIAIKTVPATEMFTIGKSVWVVHATSKEESKYRPFDQVKEGIKQELEKNKRGEMFEKEVNELKKKYNVVINEDYFKGAESTPLAEEGMEELDMSGGIAQKSSSPKGVA